MPCERIQAQLPSYLDGELGDRGSEIRGHLRTCAECRGIAEDEAVLRDGLRDLPAVDPPASLWAGVQARLAVEEVADAERPAWRRALTRWRNVLPTAPRMFAGGLVAAAAVSVLWWKTHQAPEDGQVAMPVFKPVIDNGKTLIAPSQHVATIDCMSDGADDVTASLASEPARITSCYQQTIDELLGVAADMRTNWSDDRKTAFDAKVSTMRGAIAKADEGKPQQRLARAMIRYLEGAVIREDVLLASRGDR
ncbi:MAG: zf-HC2 domain-containing protein [Kofleriaceae bacterium]